MTALGIDMSSRDADLFRLEKEKEYLYKRDQMTIPAELVMESW